MKKSTLFIFILFCIISNASCNSKDELQENVESGEANISCIQLDPLQKVFQEDSKFTEYNEVAAVAKGETVTFQFVVNSDVNIKSLRILPETLSNGSTQLEATLKAFVGYIRAGKHLTPASKDAIFPASDYYPDCLKEVENMDIPANYNQPIWVSYAIPHNATSGDYTAKIILSGTANGQKFDIKKNVKAKVYNVNLPKQTLWVTNWHSHQYMSLMNNGGKVEPFSDRYWTLMKEMAHIMRDHGQNVYFINPLTDFIKSELSGTKYSFDFTNFDKTINLFIKEGGLKRIEGGHLAHRTGEWESDYGINIPNANTVVPLNSNDAKNFLSQFIPALYNHLKDKGWWEMYIQHIGDEPVDANAQSYIQIAQYLKELVPTIRIIDAVHSHQLANTINTWVPMLNYYHENYPFYQERQKAGDEIWFYTCMDPRGNYANRFLELPLVQTRILHWINYRYGATGYLHWGFNQDWTETTQNIATDGYVPGGDTFIVYPAYNKVYSSIRLAAMRDGIADYELLKLLEQKNAAKAQELVKTIVMDFNSYNSEITHFREIRAKLLSELE